MGASTSQNSDTMASCGCRSGGNSNKSVDKNAKQDKKPLVDNDISTNDILVEPKTTDVDIQLVRDSWKTISKHMDQCGVSIFLKIFEDRPSTKQLFPFRDKNGDELLSDILFQMHAKRFMQAIGTMVDHAEGPELVLFPILIQLGQLHAIHTGESFDSYLDTFLGAVLHVWRMHLGATFIASVERAWKHLFVEMVGKLREGLSLKLTELKTIEPSEKSNIL